MSHGVDGGLREDVAVAHGHEREHAIRRVGVLRRGRVKQARAIAHLRGDELFMGERCKSLSRGLNTRKLSEA